MIARFRPIRVVLAASVVLTLASSAQAQTSGSLSTQTASPWTTAPWVPGPFPNGGGIATWLTHTNVIPGTIIPATATVITLDTPITLGGINFNSVFSMSIAGTATNNLGLATTGAIFDTQQSLVNTPSLFQFGHQISAPITGGGAAGFTKIGTGSMFLSPTVANSYTGGTNINGGFLWMSVTAAIGDGVLGATGAGNNISMNGGSLGSNVTSGWITSRDIVLNAGGGSLIPATAMTINGVISGAGSLTIPAFTGAITLTGNNSYMGATVKPTTGIMTLSGNGSINQSSSYDLGGTLNLTSSTTNNANRLNDTSAIFSRGLTMTLTGNAGAATDELVGAITMTNGLNTITVTPNAAQAASINALSITRQNNSTLFVRGTNLGAAAGAGVAQVTAGAGPALVGGGGGAGSTNISIVPWGAGNLSAAATLGSSLVTYGGTGFRPLATTEYAAAFGGGATDNVRLTAATVAPAATTANAILFAPAAAADLSGGPINVTSGTVLYSPTLTSTGTISAGLNFGAAEGFLHTTNTLNVSGAIAGIGGLTVSSIGGVVTLSGASTYTGATRLIAGQTTFAGTITNDGTPSPFGAGTSATSPIVIAPGTATTRIWVSGTSTIDRDIIVEGTGPGLSGLGSTSVFTMTINGNVAINDGRVLVLENGSTLPMTFNGNISGTGSLRDAFSTLTVLNGNNTFSGGINMVTGTYVAGSDTAFGTGTFFVSGTSGVGGTVQGAGTTPRTLANNFLLSATTTFGGTAPLTLNGGVNLNGNRTLTFTNTAMTTINGEVSSGALSKGGAGVLNLNRPAGNTYTGGTLVTGGQLLVNNTSGSGTGAGTVQMNTGTTLGGTGIISGAIQINSGATIRPGNSPGILTVGGSLTMAAGSNANFQIQSGTTPGNGAGFHSEIVATGGGASTIALGGSNLVLDFTGAAYTPMETDRIVLIDYSAGPALLTGTFAGLPDDSIAASNVLGSGINYFIYYGTLAGFANRVVLSPVPEPVSILAVSSLGLAIGYRIRRRKEPRTK